MKKNFFKILFLIGLHSLFYSCEPSREMTSTMNRYLVNVSNKVLIQELETTDGAFQLQSYGYDTVKVFLRKIIETDGGLCIACSTHGMSSVYVTKEVTYNLSDTSKVEYNLKYSVDGYLIPENENDSLYFSHFAFKSKKTDMYNIEKDVIFEYSNKLESIMQKDYTMLQKFKEYYEK